MSYQNGDIVVAKIPTRGESREIIGQIKSAHYEVSESGDPDFVYPVAGYNIRPADTNEQVEYWKARALAAERDGYGRIPGQVVPVTPTT